MPEMKTITLSLVSAAALALAGGAAYAQAPANADHAFARGADTTRDQIEQRTAAAFARMDANNDGVLDAADRDARKAQRGERRAQRLQARFDKLDADKDGAISRAEFDAPRERVAKNARAGKRFGHRGHRFGGFAARGLFKADGDKSMTQAEFTAAALERFDRADANGDGTVTRAERREAFKALRDQRRAARATAQS
jgi:Ca2+-binding EF-hand superfamily protein